MALLRYNGGKAKLVKKILPHITLHGEAPVFCEPFVGGGSVGLAVAKKYPNARIVLNDLDPQVYAFWNQIVCSSDHDFARLYDRVLSCHPTIEQFYKLQATKATDQTDLAFRTLFFNRVAHSASNGKRPLGGRHQKRPAIGERFRNPKRIATEMLGARRLLTGRTTVFNKDFADVMLLAERNWTFYCDPPYYEAGNVLYNHPWEDADHVRLCELLKNTPGDWVLSYDFHPRIVELYNHGRTRSYPLPASYSISRRREIEALIVPSNREKVSPDGFSVPKNFDEFYRRYPSYVRAFAERKMRWSRAVSETQGEWYTVFEATIEDYTQDLLLFLSALPKNSKYRARGFSDPIQLFNPSLWGNVTQGKFFAYIKMLLSNRFQTLRTKEHKDALLYSDSGLGAALDIPDFVDETGVDLQTYRHFVERERPALLRTFDSFFDRDLRGQVDGFESKRSRLVALLRNYFVRGKLPVRKEYKKRKTKTSHPKAARIHRVV